MQLNQHLNRPDRQLTGGKNLKYTVKFSTYCSVRFVFPSHFSFIGVTQGTTQESPRISNPRVRPVWGSWSLLEAMVDYQFNS